MPWYIDDYTSSIRFNVYTHYGKTYITWALSDITYLKPKFHISDKEKQPKSGQGLVLQYELQDHLSKPLPGNIYGGIRWGTILGPR